MVDALMMSEAVSGFTMSAVDGFSRQHSRYDVAEQVAGYRRMCRVEIRQNAEDQPELLATLARAAGSERIQYWVTPLLCAGSLGGENTN